jgi:hypothetical protein
LEDEPNMVVEQMEAWLPEAMAEHKLRGFAEAIGGEIVESLPGLVRVQCHRPQDARKSGGLLGWFGLGRKAVRPRVPELSIELHLRPKDPSQRGLLEVTVLLRSGPPGAPPPGFQDRCAAIGHTLRSFLMCQG